MRFEETAATLQPQPFESGLLGGSVFRLVLPPLSLSILELAPILEAVRQTNAALISCRLAAGHDDLIAILQSSGFRPIETLVTYRRPLKPLPPPPAGAIRQAVAADSTPCVAIARRSFMHDRFHADPAIDGHAADEIKAAWVANAFQGRADAILVAEDGGEIAGFVSCLLSGTEAVIDLIAVAEEKQRRGIGAALVAGALRHYEGRADTLRVGTQRSNLSSTRLYRRFDFVRVDESVTLHLTPKASA